MKEPAPIHVAVGVIHSDGRFLVTRRQAGAHLEGAWEFPGGKLRAGESAVEALRREVEEEVGLRIRDAVLVHVEEYAYPERTVRIDFFLCLDPEGEPSGRQGQVTRWATLSDLKGLPTPPANRQAIRILEEQFGC